jgi:hypothetical protein
VVSEAAQLSGTALSGIRDCLKAGFSRSESEVLPGKVPAFVLTQAEEKADPSTSLRFGRDDTFYGEFFMANFRLGTLAITGRMS